MTAPNPDYFDALRARREARAALVTKRIELVDNAIDLCDALDKALGSITVPGIDVDELVQTACGNLKSLYLNLERLRGYDE